MSAKHARPTRPGIGRITGGVTGRRLATAAIILAAGAAPLAAAASAQADSGLDLVPGSAVADATSADAFPLVNDLPMGLSGLTAPVTDTLPMGAIMPAAQQLPVVGGALPLVSAVPSLTDALPVGAVAGLPVDGLPVGQLLPRSAPMPGPLGPLGLLNGAALSSAAMGPGGLGGLGSAAQTAQSTVTDSVATSTSAAVVALAATMPNGGLGGLTAGVAPQTDPVTAPLFQQAGPVAGQLERSGVPTIGSLTNQLSQTPLPAAGTVGHLTQTLPISSVLGTSNPLANALNSATQL